MDPASSVRHLSNVDRPLANASETKINAVTTDNAMAATSEWQTNLHEVCLTGKVDQSRVKLTNRLKAP